MHEPQDGRWLNRRAFLQGGTLVLAASAFLPEALRAATDEKPKLRLGLVTDLHYADKPSGGSRRYRESLAKVAEAAKQFVQEKADLVVCLGDLIDTAPALDAERGYLKRIVEEFAGMPGKRHFVLGNHCVENLVKEEFLATVGQEKSFYSFDAAGWHFVVLDACFTSAGTAYGRKNFKWSDALVPPAELEWLRGDLERASRPSIVFVHQCLDVDPPYGVKNRAEVRKILAESGKVRAVIQGHHHRGNYQELGGVHYCTLKAMVEGAAPEHNAYAMLDILPGGALRVTGFRTQPNYRWPAG